RANRTGCRRMKSHRIGLPPASTLPHTTFTQKTLCGSSPRGATASRRLTTTSWTLAAAVFTGSSPRRSELWIYDKRHLLLRSLHGRECASCEGCRAAVGAEGCCSGLPVENWSTGDALSTAIVRGIWNGLCADRC